jgi:ribonuclease BN (tRNA processing enzyme)
MRVILLGTGGWTPTDTRETACVYLRDGARVILLDAGTGVRRLLTAPELMNGVDRVDVLLSHFHLDHIIGLSYLPGLGPDVHRVVWGPGAQLYGASTTEILERLIGPPLFALSIPEFISRVEDLKTGDMEISRLSIAVRRQDRHNQPSVALRVGDAITYCTDTGYDSGNASFAGGSRILLHEAFYLQPADDMHSTSAEAASIARDAGVSQLKLVHLHPGTTDEGPLLRGATRIFSATEVGRDLDALKGLS